MGKATKITSIVIVSIAVLGITGFIMRESLISWFFSPTDSSVPVGIESSERIDNNDAGLSTVAEGLEVPWDIVQLPDGDLLITERKGTVRRIGQTPLEYSISDVTQTSEGGLLGMALDPDFNVNNYIYFYMTISNSNELENQIVRYSFVDNDFRDKTVIFSSIPGASTHDGGKIAFGPDGYLYATTGDANEPELAQNIDSLAGKILRIAKDGSIPSDNPFQTAVYSYGHRNPQGIAWDSEGRLWSTEHGRSGAQSGFDELNLIIKGGNYGWPEIQGDETREDMIAPVAHSGPNETWAPAGLSYADGELFFSGLRGRRLYQATINQDGGVILQAHFIQEFGRLRASTIIGETLYISTSNRDGRGQPLDTDDRIIKIPLRIFGE